MRRRKKQNGLNSVIENVRPYAEEVGSKAGPMVESGRQRLSGAMSTAAEASEPYRREAALRGRGAWEALSGGDLREMRRRQQRNRRLALFGSLTVLAIGAAVTYWMVRTAPPTPWHPDVADDLDHGGRSAEPHGAPESESKSGSETSGGPKSSAKATEDAKPSTPPHQRTSSNTTSSSR